MPVFSIVIPTRNRIDLLRLTLESVRGQSFKDYEIIVVDDCSDDGSVAELVQTESDIKLLRQPQRRGVSAARNAGIAAALGTYIAFLDDDDLWMPWTLEIYDRALRRHDRPAIVSSNGAVFDEMHEVDAIQCSALEEQTFSDYLDYATTTDKHGWLLPTGVVMRADVAKRGFDTALTYYEDEDMWLGAGTGGGFIRIVQPLCWAYRSHAASASKKVQPRFVNMLHLIAKERRSEYPGGRDRRSQRLEIITRLARNLARRGVKAGFLEEGWQLYCALFAWNIEHARWAFLCLFPCELVAAAVSGRAAALNTPRGPGQ